MTLYPSLLSGFNVAIPLNINADIETLIKVYKLFLLTCMGYEFTKLYRKVQIMKYIF